MLMNQNYLILMTCSHVQPVFQKKRMVKVFLPVLITYGLCSSERVYTDSTKSLATKYNSKIPDFNFVCLRLEQNSTKVINVQIWYFRKQKAVPIINANNVCQINNIHLFCTSIEDLAFPVCICTFLLCC